MKYSADERKKIGKEIFDGKYTVAMAAEVYGISFYSARGYLRSYKAAQSLSAAEPKESEASEPEEGKNGKCVPEEREKELRARLKSMTRKELEEEHLKSLLKEEEIRQLLG